MTVTIKKTIEAEIEFTPEELGEAFASLDGEQMAAFFNAVAAQVATWENAFCFQMQSVTDAPNLGKAARAIMWVIGDYSDESTSTVKNGMKP